MNFSNLLLAIGRLYSSINLQSHKNFQKLEYFLRKNLASLYCFSKTIFLLCVSLDQMYALKSSFSGGSRKYVVRNKRFLLISAE